ncbi:FAD-dependent oxidoreductase [Legionella jordanis]|uniref:Gamma-glutamylputrescine oxidoreductase n=1 Tax=Legionella jordanis TaxID=456 RepID=A0A0W0V7K6_9GAMM|nr:FAD-dependent oxidoreductase [Legionella jordanis]KTD16047.1 Gamma-glutamylputrescine oxidoreductase [Legionella jordanis]VEH12494.1 Gamma-glutamylputrescine oxidoreductase [Legionella jordanis]
MKGISLWKSISSRPSDYPHLNSDIEVDVAIIGGGITGVTAAMELSKAGKKVAVIESGQMGGATTSMSTGNLYVQTQPSYQRIASAFDLNTAKQVAHSRQMAIDYIEKNVRALEIPCHFSRRPWYGYSDAQKESYFSKEIETLKEMGLDVEYISSLPLELKFKKAAVLQNQARFNPLQYVLSMAAELAKQGCLIYENTHVIDIKENKDDCVIRSKSGRITAQKLFMATHSPLGFNKTQMFIAPYSSYVVAAYINRDEYPEGQFWGFTDNSFILSTHSVKEAKPEILLVAGSHHKTGQSQNMQGHIAEIEKYLHENFSVSEVAFRWSAQHFQAADKLPYIGLASHSSKHSYMATGFFADGLTYGTLAGILVADHILNNSNPFFEIYQSNRSNLMSSIGFISKENLNVMAQYAKDLPLAEETDFSSLPMGEGRVVEINREKCAVSRDSSNKLHIVSAVCTHMKCIVKWNNAEQTWDCPCHGSRFKPSGEVIEGPAMIDLENKEIKS